MPAGVLAVVSVVLCTDGRSDQEEEWPACQDSAL